jgi:phosphoribosylamine--glycine ligase
MGKPLSFLLLGAGAREHALALSLSRAPNVHKIFVCPGNGGLKRFCTCFPFSTNADLLARIKDTVDLAIVGSSKFITTGTVDALVTAGIPVIAPAADAGRIETSKAFSAAFIARHNVPAPVTQVVTNPKEALAFLEENPWVGVVKCDGFSRGTGVAVVNSSEEAEEAVLRLFKTHGPPLILQEKLSGMECSYSILTDGKQWVSFSSSHDYKRVGDGDTGPTTGGMGSISPCPSLSPELDQQIRERIVVPTVAGLAKDGLIYRGFLSFQLMLTSRGPRVLEFNARLGDPETQSILARFRGNLADLLMDCALGRLDSAGSEVAFGKHWGISVVLARRGYPLDESIEAEIDNMDEVKDSQIFHSGSDWNDRQKLWKFGSGRLVSVTAMGETIEDARKTCYNDIDRLRLKNVIFRRDIGATGVA